MFGKIARAATLVFVSFILSGCAIPIGARAVIWMGEGIVYATTSKSLTDHGLSLASDQDCSILRAVLGEELCQENEKIEEDELR